MLRTFFKRYDQAAITKTAVWLSKNGEKEAAKKVMIEMLKDDPANKSLRLMYSQIECNNVEVSNQHEELNSNVKP